MKNILLLFVAALLITACSSPKYAYHFDTHDYNSGRKNQPATASVEKEVSPLIIDQTDVVADASSTPNVTEKKPSNLTPEQKQIVNRIKSMSKPELKQFKKELKTELKKQIKESKKAASVEGDSNKATKEWDHDLKMAAIFGIVGLVLSAFGGVSPVFWILGIICVVVGVVFLIQWISRQ